MIHYTVQREVCLQSLHPVIPHFLASGSDVKNKVPPVYEALLYENLLLSLLMNSTLTSYLY